MSTTTKSVPRELKKSVGGRNLLSSQSSQLLQTSFQEQVQKFGSGEEQFGKKRQRYGEEYGEEVDIVKQYAEEENIRLKKALKESVQNWEIMNNFVQNEFQVKMREWPEIVAEKIVEKLNVKTTSADNIKKVIYESVYQMPCMEFTRQMNESLGSVKEALANEYVAPKVIQITKEVPVEVIKTEIKEVHTRTIVEVQLAGEVEAKVDVKGGLPMFGSNME